MGVTAQPISLYLDEMIPVVLAPILRQYGYDVLAASTHLCLKLLGRTESKDLINQLRFLQEFV
jgi:hypothetical protein